MMIRKPTRGPDYKLSKLIVLATRLGEWSRVSWNAQCRQIKSATAALLPPGPLARNLLVLKNIHKRLELETTTNWSKNPCYVKILAAIPKLLKTSVHGGILQYVLVFWKVYWSTLRIPYTWTVLYGLVFTKRYHSIGFSILWYVPRIWWYMMVYCSILQCMTVYCKFKKFA
jgi:hypothetical protein